MSDIATLTRMVSELSNRLDALSARVPARIGTPRPSDLVIDIHQEAHGFTAGQAVHPSAGAWSLFTDNRINMPHRGMWGIVCGVTGANSFRLTIGGTARTTKTDLVVGAIYTFVDGEPVRIYDDIFPINRLALSFSATAISTTSVLVANDSRFDSLQDHGGTYAIMGHADINFGHYVVYSGVPTGESPLALADKDNPWRWTNVGIALFVVIEPAGWLILTNGSHAWDMNGSGLPSWMSATPYNFGQRLLLSDTNPGQYATTEPELKVYAGISVGSYDSEEGITSFSATAVGVGTVYPIPPSGGGTGLDISLINEHSTIATLDGKLHGYLNLGTIAVWTQDSGGAPAWLTLDATPGGSFGVESGTLYALVCGEKTSTTAPSSTNDLLRWNGTEWEPFFLVKDKGFIVSHDGTGYFGVDASVPLSVLGNPTESAAVPVAISASTDNTIFGRRGGVLTYAKVSLTTEVSGSLPLANGGTGATDAPSARISIGAIKGVAAAGNPYTSTSTWTVPSGVHRVLVAAIAGGGGGGWGPSAILAAIGYIASTSGGAVTHSLDIAGGGYGGGTGAMVLAWVDVIPGETISFTVGPGGAGASTFSAYASAGSPTVVTFPSSGGTLTCGGGGAASQWLSGPKSGNSGAVTNAIATSRNPVVVVVPGASGGTSHSDLGTDAAVNARIPGVGHPAETLFPGTNYGVGGAPAAGAGAAGQGGAVGFFY